MSKIDKDSCLLPTSPKLTFLQMEIGNKQAKNQEENLY